VENIMKTGLIFVLYHLNWQTQKFQITQS